jgi:hypothetical protein
MMINFLNIRQNLWSQLLNCRHNVNIVGILGSHSLEEFCSLTILSRPGEARDEFNKRLIAFWTLMLRTREADYERVYAEHTAFAPIGDRLSREYMLEPDVADVVEEELTKIGLEFQPIDRDELFSKYEATPPDWFQIEH